MATNAKREREFAKRSRKDEKAKRKAEREKEAAEGKAPSWDMTSSDLQEPHVAEELPPVAGALPKKTGPASS